MKKSKYLMSSLALILMLLSGCTEQDDFPVLTGPHLGQEPPGITPELFAPGIISTKDNIEFAGTFSPDLKEFFFTRRKNGTIDNRIYHVDGVVGASPLHVNTNRYPASNSASARTAP